MTGSHNLERNAEHNAEHNDGHKPASSGWDLHCHTVFSDGTYSPTQLIRMAYEKGLHGVAISDHDTIAGWGEAKQVALNLHFPLIRGTEITAQHDH